MEYVAVVRVKTPERWHQVSRPAIRAASDCGMWVVQIFDNLVGCTNSLRQNSEFNRGDFKLTN